MIMIHSYVVSDSAFISNSDFPLFLTLLTFQLRLPSDSAFPVLFYLYIRLRAYVLIPLE